MTTRKGKRTRVHVDARDEKRLMQALRRWAETGDFVALRTRAFALLLWDGAIRTRGALALNAEDVVSDPDASRSTVKKEVVTRPTVENRYRPRSIVLSARTQEALLAYLRVVRRDGWLPTQRMRGPLFLSSVHQGEGQRLSVRSAIYCWESFQKNYAFGCSREYQLDDLVYTGRMEYLHAAGGDSESLSTHSGISRRWAAEYRDESNVSPQDVMAKLDKKR